MCRPSVVCLSSVYDVAARTAYTQRVELPVTNFPSRSDSDGYVLRFWKKFDEVLLLGDRASYIEGGMKKWRFSTNISLSETTRDTAIITMEDE